MLSNSHLVSSASWTQSVEDSQVGVAAIVQMHIAAHAGTIPRRIISRTRTG